MAVNKFRSMRDAIAEFIPDGASVALGLQMEQMIPFAAGHELIRQKKRGLTLIGPISDILVRSVDCRRMRGTSNRRLGGKRDDGVGI